jgi:Cu(I)/Ag(I) efflux system membrane fusion protein
MYVNASIAVNSGEVLAMPEEAVFNTGTKQSVFVDKGNGIFEPRDVKTGFKADRFYELKEGVQEGESVVTSGNFLIDSESRLKAALEGMDGAEAHQHGQ